MQISVIRLCFSANGLRQFRTPCRRFGSTTMLRNGSDNDDRAAKFPAMTTPMLPKGTFDNKVAFITGGGSGLGKGMASMLSQLGAKVCIASRKEGVLKKVAAEIEQASKNEIFPVAADVRDAASVKNAVDQCVSKFGIPDVVINNAAGNFICPFERLSSNGFRTVVDIVLNGTGNVTLDIGKRLIANNRRGAFLSITTIYAQSGSGFVVPSAAAKAGVENMAKSLAAEWSRYGLRFNNLAPGPIYTEGAFSRLDPTGQFAEHAKNRNPSRRFGEVEELSNLACYLLSDYASWINGATINFDGGELPFLSGEMNTLTSISPESWDAMESMIRKNDKTSKSGQQSKL